MNILVVFGENLESMKECWVKDWEKELNGRTGSRGPVVLIDIGAVTREDLGLSEIEYKIEGEDKVAQKLALKIKEVIKDTVETLNDFLLLEETLVELFQTLEELNMLDDKYRQDKIELKLNEMEKLLPQAKKEVENVSFTIYLYDTDYTDRIYELLTANNCIMLQDLPYEMSVVKKNGYFRILKGDN